MVDAYKKGIFLGGGAVSNAWLSEDGRYVIRTPKSEYLKTKWLKESEKEISIVEKLQDINCEHCFVPKSELKNLDDGNVCVVSLYAGSREFREKVYKKELTENERKNIARDFAVFLYKLHHLKNEDEPIPDNYVKDVQEKTKDVEFPDDLKDIFLKAINSVEHNKNFQKQKGFCHNDLIKDNILWNEKTKKCAVIDFESSVYGSIYRDFGTLGRPGQFGVEFLENVVKYYNNICINEHQPEVDFNLVKQVVLLRSFDKTANYYGKESDADWKFRLDKLRECYDELFHSKQNMLEQKNLITDIKLGRES